MSLRYFAMEKIDEEFNNFMHRVTEISSIVKDMNSEEEIVRNIAMHKAQEYLQDERRTTIQNIDDETVVLKVTADRTSINKNALEEKISDGASMSQEAFMKEVSRDADMRHKDKMVRREKMGTFKKQATLAFRRGQYEKALNYYNKAIEQIRDCCMLYNNRCLTNINLKLYDKAVSDAETALKLNENCLKSWLLMAKAQYLAGKRNEAEAALREASIRNEEQANFIQNYKAELYEEVISCAKD